MGNKVAKMKRRLARRIKGYEDDLRQSSPGAQAMMNKPGSQNRNKK